MIKRVIRSIEKYRLLGSGDKVLIALSGGADSMFLLDALESVQKLYSLKLYIAHLNHSLRKRADEDAEFVKNIARGHNIPCIIDKVQGVGVQKLSEQEAREIRYKFLEKAAREVGANKIAIGHTMTDEAETFLLRVIRGTGLKGLALIPPKRDKIIRPLVEIEHNEILKFLKVKGIKYRKDYSNYKCKHARNFVRYRIMPQITRLSPDFAKKTMRLRDIVDAEESMLESITEDKFKELMKNTVNTLQMDLNGFLKEDLAMRRRLIRKAGELLAGKSLSFEETENIIGWIDKNKDAGQVVQARARTYPVMGEWSVRVQKDVILFETGGKRGSKCKSKLLHSIEEIGKIDFPVPGEVQAGKFRLRAQILNGNNTLGTFVKVWNPFPQFVKEKVYFDIDKLVFPLFVRGRRSGDIFCGNGYTKKIKALFIDDKVPRRERDFIPLLFDQDGILWIVKHRRSSKALIDENTTRVLEVETRTS